MKHRLLKLSLALGLGLSLFCALMVLWGQPVSLAAGVNYYVNQSGGNNGNACTTLALPCATIQAAIDKAGVDDIINISGETYSGANPLATVNKSLTIKGAGASTILDGGSAGRVIAVSGAIRNAAWYRSSPRSAGDQASKPSLQLGRSISVSSSRRTSECTPIS